MAGHGWECAKAYGARMKALGKSPIVLVMRKITPRDAAGIVAHGERRIGDNEHVDEARTPLNWCPIGERDEQGRSIVARRITQVVLTMAELNHRSHVDGVRRKEGKAAAKALRDGGAPGVQTAWRDGPKQTFPMRELVGGVASEYCDAGPDCPADQRLEFTDTEGRDRVWDKRIMRGVMTEYTAWLRARFGDEIVYLRWDCDEDGLHFHAIHMRIEEHAPTQRYTYGRALIRSQGHPLIGETRDEDGVPVTGYEVAQDDVAAWFAEPERADMNLVRGHRTADQERRLGALTDWLVEHMPAPRPMSKKAHKRWALRKVMEDPTAMSLNKRDAEKLGLDLLIAAGRIPEKRLKEKSTVRWRQEMLREYGGALVNVDDLRRDPVSAYERVLAKVAQDARSARRDLAELDAREGAEGAAAAREAADLVSFADAQRRYEDRLAAEERGELKAQVEAEMRAAEEEHRRQDEAAEGRRKEADAAAALRRQRDDEAAAAARHEANADAADAGRRKRLALNDERARIEAERAAHDARMHGFEAGREMMREGVYYWDPKTKTDRLRLKGKALEEARRTIAPAREDLRPVLIAEAEASEARGAARAADEKRAQADAEAARRRDQEAEAARSQIAARLGLVEVLEEAVPQFERSEDRFPDAWAMQHPKDDAALKRLDDDLARMTNRQVAVASRDGAALYEPGELQQRFHRGWTVLSFEAGRRGLCLDTGEHHPDRATDSARARIHTDQEPCPIHIIQRTLAQQRTI